MADKQESPVLSILVAMLDVVDPLAKTEIDQVNGTDSANEDSNAAD